MWFPVDFGVSPGGHKHRTVAHTINPQLGTEGACSRGSGLRRPARVVRDTFKVRSLRRSVKCWARSCPSGPSWIAAKTLARP
jgi:hypothetical protein